MIRPHFVQYPVSEIDMTRLVPRTRTHSIEEGIQAKVKDPLWFLSRQWQLGEFRAKNAGQPVKTEISYKIQDINEIKLCDADGFRKLPQPETPMETVVEREELTEGSGSPAPKAWDTKQLEYRFSIRSGKTQLNAREYFGGRLDWYDFSLGSKPVLDAEVSLLKAMPAMVSFRGMPNARWWKFEDGTVDLGEIQRSNLNFLSMLLIEFCLLYSGNWFVVPMVQQCGTIRLVEMVWVTDTFGIVWDIDPIADTSKDEHLWSLYSLSGSENVPSAGSQLFYLPNCTVQPMESDPLEQVIFSRDELANMVWAMERKYFDIDNMKATDRDDQELVLEVPDPQPAGDMPLYRLKSRLPSNWIPYMPIQPDWGKGSTILRRSRTDEQFNKRNPQYKGKIISESVYVQEEEIPGTPVELARKYKLVTPEPEKWELVRDSKGWSIIGNTPRKVEAWVGRTKQPYTKQPSSKLRFDYVVEKK